MGRGAHLLSVLSCPPQRVWQAIHSVRSPANPRPRDQSGEHGPPGAGRMTCVTSGSGHGRGTAVRITLSVNGEQRTSEVEPRRLLVHHLRDDLGLTGTNVGCDTSSCGACTVLLDGESVKACTVLAVQADCHEVPTIEGLAPAGDGLHPMQQAFHEEHGLQCGYCTPGVIMAGASLVGEKSGPQ